MSGSDWTARIEPPRIEDTSRQNNGAKTRS